MNNKIITSHQLYTFTALSTLGGSILVASSIVAGIAKQDAWISVIVTMAFGLVMMWVYTYLVTRFDNLTIIGVSQKIFGKWIGKIIAIGYFLYMFITAYDIPWYIGSFFTNIKHETPVDIIIVLFYAALIIGVYYGIETIARATELFFVLVTGLFIIFILLVIPDINIEFALPVFENGINPILKSAVILSGYISIQNTTLLMIFPVNLSDKVQGRKAFIKGFIWANTIVLITVLVSILVLGSLIIAKSSFPTVLLAKEINIGSVFTRLEYLISFMWTLSEFTIAVMYFYSSILAFSELLGLKAHTWIVAPMGLLCMMFTLTVNTGAIEKENGITTGFIPNVITFGFIVPIIMLAVFFVRRIVNPSFGRGRP